MKNVTFPSISGLFSLFAFLTLLNLNAQVKTTDIVDSYQDYTSDAREVVYVHLNKSAYIKGESIGFTAYVLDKKDKKPSQLTTNLYISIEDENNNVVKQKLLKVEQGVASNVIVLDSTFTSGYYNFKAYTNWMRNFDEQNYFVESIRIIDPKAEEYIETASAKNSVDAQFLPEGGHLLNGVVNNVGVVLKDSKGYGIPSIKGEVRDHKDNLITDFEVNKFGIGRFPLRAESGKIYKINFTYLNKAFSFTLNEKIEPIGVTLSLVNHRNKAIVSLITNKESLEVLKNRPYTLAIHNGEKITTLDIVFDNELTIIKAFELNEMPSGMNMFTLFDENNEAFIERLFFNYHGINILASNELSATKANDSITMKLNFKQVNPNEFNTLSVSVLPQETSSYNRHHNILSYTYLQPYVKGVIEQAKYYFTDITQEKQFELDNLLITQGWSSYDWKAIFKPKNGLNYPFEQGITLKANINGESRNNQDKYMVHANSEQEPQFFEVNQNGKEFIVPNVFLNEQDKIYLSKVNKNDELEPAKLYLQAFPNKIPSIQMRDDIIKPKWDYKTFSGLKNTNISFLNITNIQSLDEVVVTSAIDRKKVRMEELSKGRLGKVKVIDDGDRIQHQTLANYLNFNGLKAYDSNGKFIVSTFSDQTPAIFLDDMRLIETSMLYRFPLNNVDYVEINRFANGTTINSTGGVLKIYTDYSVRGSTANAPKTQDYKLPLTFSNKKKFYTPKYRYYNDDFYKGYGTIDWKPELITDSNGNISIKIAEPEVPITLFIEGIANDGSFIFEERTLSLN